MAEPVRTIYQCSNPKCAAFDSDRGNNPPAPRLLICWKCRAGAGASEEQMFENRVGMFVVNN